MNPTDQPESIDRSHSSDESLPSVAFLNSLDTITLVLNEEGLIVALNDACRFHFKKLDSIDVKSPRNHQYQELLSSLILENEKPVIDGVEDVLEDSKSEFSTSYRTVIAGEKREYRLHCQSFRNGEKPLVTVVHRRLESLDDPSPTEIPKTTLSARAIKEMEKNQVQFEPGGLAGPESSDSPNGDSDDSNKQSSEFTYRQELIELLKELQKSTRKFVQAETIDQVTETGMDIFDEYFDYSTAGFRLFKDGKLVMITDRKNDERLEGRVPPDYDVGEGFVGKAFEEGEPRVYSDLQEASEGTPFNYSPMESALLLPVGPFGIVGIASDQPDAFDEFDVELGRHLTADFEAALIQAEREQTLRRRERELRETSIGENYLRTILDTLPAGVLITDTDGEIKKVNKALERM
ncbi:MAG: GAF domain-containing protein, partial [bacterium]